MSTVAQLISRIKRDWLEGADYQPTRFTLAAAISSTSATTFTYSDALLSPEETALLGSGTLIEIDSEEMILEDVDEDTNTVTVAIRGANGTTAATHSSGVEALISPTWRRKVIFDAICDAVVELYPDLYAVASTSVSLSSNAITEVPATVMEPLWVWGRLQGETLYSKYPVEFFDQFDGSSTGKAIFAPGLTSTATGYLVYKKQFARPGSESVNLITTTGLDEQWERIVLVSTAAYLIAGRELDQVERERLTDQLAQQGFPVLTATRIRQSLLQYRDQLMEKAQDSLRARFHTLVTVNPGF